MKAWRKNSSGTRASGNSVLCTGYVIFESGGSTCRPGAMKKILNLLGLFACCAARAQTIEWPNHKKAVIVLTYDDALQSQLDVAVPQLRNAGFKATFFLTCDIDYNTIPRWRALAKKGFELANHSLFHPCLSSKDNPVFSDHYTPGQMAGEIDVMNNLLFALDGKSVRTYAYPCTETTVGGIDYVDTLRQYNLVKYARIGGDTSAVITDFSHLDFFRVPSMGVADNTDTADKLIGFVDSVRQRSGMGIIMFHGIGGDYITTSSKAHQDLLDYLRKNRDLFWITTFQEAMDYVAHWRALQQPKVGLRR